MVSIPICAMCNGPTTANLCLSTAIHDSCYVHGTSHHPMFLQNLSSKWVVPTDNMRQSWMMCTVVKGVTIQTCTCIGCSNVCLLKAKHQCTKCLFHAQRIALKKFVLLTFIPQHNRGVRTEAAAATMIAPHLVIESLNICDMFKQLTSTLWSSCDT